MIVRKFMQWAIAASPKDRAEGAVSLVHAYLYAGLDPIDRREAEVALTAFLDDPSPSVRRAIAEAFSAHSEAPLSIIVALANDQSEVSAPILRGSPLLGDCELIDCALVGDSVAQTAIAMRPSISPQLSIALADVGQRPALTALARNHEACIPESALCRMVARFGDDAEVREAILSRPDLPAAVRSDLVAAVAKALTQFAVGCSWLSQERAARVERESCEKSQAIIVSEPEGNEDWRAMRHLIHHIRNNGRLNAGLLLRALLCGRRWPFEAALVELSGLPENKALALARDWRGAGFEAIYAKAGLPDRLLPAFKAALAAQKRRGSHDVGIHLSRTVIREVIAACQRQPSELGALQALLRRYDVEAAREEAREAARVIFMPQLEAPPVIVTIDQADFGAAPRLISIDLEAIEAEMNIQAEMNIEVEMNRDAVREAA